MSAITVSRQVGSRGDELAALVAQRLGWRLVGRELINQAAREAGVPEVALAEMDELRLLDIRPSTRDWRAYQLQVERIIRNLADEGRVVIVGRGSQIVLRERPGVLHVRVVAPLAQCLEWLQQERGLSREAAIAYLATSSRTRARYIRRSYHVDVNDPALYHLVVNTGLLALEQAANVIIQALREIGGL
ncbi:MAG: cytidylate kinase-like family protein [Anaerolineae bacterium]|nr:cytidylate kinase-like family protein [Anaerolineae bacterium]MDW8071497.1 cytidylate kinase-like family protein [Anaerolineae bacterium]